MLISKSDFLFIPQIRDDILKSQYSQSEAIKYDVLQYVEQPYTIKTFIEAVEYNSPQVINACIDDIDANILQSNKHLINNIYNLDNFKKLEAKLDIDLRDYIRFEGFFRNNCIDIIDYLLGEKKYSLNYMHNIYTVEAYRLLVNKYHYDSTQFMLDEWVIIDLLNNNEPNFECSLVDAMYNRYDTVVDYILYKRNFGLTEDEICELIDRDVYFLEIASYNIDKHVNSLKIAYALLAKNDKVMTYTFIQAGLNPKLLC